ncbi:NAD(P)H-dependent oxidoreductase [Protaetiibacter sp. SSC-01]|uniref:flavodoxin family protein n=1 Tax=Protaetiibacter sp. SSC-01 TaxID=2759943 RepID=UPI0016570B4E|nr:flavodoxin family protein [Protaetiibacter sp. SSC-01]QNO37737.1 NAD(P)H-dependent oxidoreductase [Protaetiibacter sp. SSC-01]
MALHALALNCTLKPSPAVSSTERLAREVLDALEDHGVEGEHVRVVDLDIRPGVEKDMGDGDEWPRLRDKILATDILVFATPTWMGQTTSVGQRVLERLDAELSETDAEGRPTMFGKVAIVAVVGNEDGAHHICADVFQALDDVGFTIPAQGCTYWNGEAMGSVDYIDLNARAESTDAATATAAANAAHLAGLLAASAYPVPES